MTSYNKKSLSVEQQIARLQERGLCFSGRFPKEQAIHYLQNISYYRLSAYLHPFYKPDKHKHQFIADTTFEDVLQLYIFDRELRLHLLDAIERIEVSLRAQLTQVLADSSGPFGYLESDSNVFDTRYNSQWLKEELQKKTKPGAQNKENFLRHYKDKYPNSPDYPPVWMALELLSFKQVSRCFSGLRQNCDQKIIAHYYQWPFVVLKSWFRVLSDLRNFCAHQARVWNREFGLKPVWPKKQPMNWAEVSERLPITTATKGIQTINARSRLYFQVVIIESLLKIISPKSDWGNKLKALFRRYPSVSKTHMGFPEQWHQTEFWQRLQGDA